MRNPITRLRRWWYLRHLKPDPGDTLHATGTVKQVMNADFPRKRFIMLPMEERRDDAPEAVSTDDSMLMGYVLSSNIVSEADAPSVAGGGGESSGAGASGSWDSGGSDSGSSADAGNSDSGSPSDNGGSTNE